MGRLILWMKRAGPGNETKELPWEGRMKINIGKRSNRKDVLLLLASGLVGAVASRWLVLPRRWRPQREPSHDRMPEPEADGDRQPKTLTAKRLSLVDDAGRTRAVLGIDADGMTALQFNDKQGNARLMLNVADDGAPSVLLFDPGNVLRASLFIGENNPVAELRLRDRQGSERAYMAVTPDGEPQLELRDGNGRQVPARI